MTTTVLNVRTGKKATAQVWNGRVDCKDRTTNNGDIVGRWDPAGSAKEGDWKVGDELVFLDRPNLTSAQEAAEQLEEQPQEVVEIRLTAKPGAENYADCDGVYKLAPHKQMNGQPVFECQAKGRFIAWTGQHWNLTALHYQEELLAKQGAFGGFHGHRDLDNTQAVRLADTVWEQYNLALIAPSNVPSAAATESDSEWDDIAADIATTPPPYE
jgi:hypothetical protein